MKSKNFKRNCPHCEKEILYSNEAAVIRANNNNSLC